MESLISIGKFILANYQALISGLVLLFTAAITVALIIPGPQPEGWLTSIRDFLAKFSKKPEDK